MNTEMILEVSCNDVEQSLALAKAMGQNLKGGEVIELISDVGGGKTTFVRGLAEGMGSADRVSSPSFTLTNQYRSDKLTMQHFDFYRLSEPGIMKQELAEYVHDAATVTVVEWADIVTDVLPADRVSITIAAVSDNSRQYRITYCDTAKHIIEHIV